jgi:hypothetical protein
MVRNQDPKEFHTIGIGDKIERGLDAHGLEQAAHFIEQSFE